MSRSGYNEDCDQTWDWIMWRGAVASAIRGKRGQAFLKEMLAALDALPEKKLIAEDLEANGAVCAIGAVGKARGIDMSELDPYDREGVAGVFGIPHSLACEIFYMNDEAGFVVSPEDRFVIVRRWIESSIKPEPSTLTKGER
jgi:hypothetical protein